jgi:S1-C subfamily serine protease
MRRAQIAAVTLIAAASVAIAACGDEESVAPAISSTTDEQDDAKRVVIEAEDGAFDAQTIYETAAEGVVTVRSVIGGGGTPDIFGGGGGQGQGSGFVISEEGEILTNAHVVTDADAAGAQSGPLHEAREVYVQFADLNQVEADIVGFDPFADVALLRVDPEGLDLHPLPLGSENDVEVGEGVAAIGSPFGQEQSLSVGIVSASDRSIESLSSFRIDGAIQTDASINPGNSGGPLIDAAGEVVGINQQIQTASGGSEGVGFAVPIDLAQRSIDDLRGDGEVSYAYAGVTTTPLYPQLAEELGLDVDTGALVSEVVDGGPADEAGLQAGDDAPIRFQAQDVDAGGDVIVAVDGEPIDAEADLPRLISLADPGDLVTLDIIRDGDEEQIEVELGERPVEVPRP